VIREPFAHKNPTLASLAESGQQTPIVVVVSPDNRERYLVIDGHKRVVALEQLGRDTGAVPVEAVIHPIQ
jgi:ParB-like chromosome segregation protein Spo0J